MNNFIRYSYCVTVYNSVEAIQRFYRSISTSMNDNSELVIVDSFSNDGTYEELLKIKEKDSRVKVIRKKCLRGKGRQLAIDVSKGEIIVILDVDGEYFNVEKYIREFEQRYEDKLLVYWIRVAGFDLRIVIGKRKTFELLGGYPNLNNTEDLYLYRVAEHLGLLERGTIPRSDVIPIYIKNLSSGNERRYARNFLEAVVRRIIATRDTLFVLGLKHNELNRWYQLGGWKKYFIGYPLFFVGKILRFTIKDETIEDRVDRIRKAMKNQ